MEKAECVNIHKKTHEKMKQLEEENNCLKFENDHLQARIHWLEGKVEAFEYCIKNGRVK